MVNTLVVVVSGSGTSEKEGTKFYKNYVVSSLLIIMTLLKVLVL